MTLKPYTVSIGQGDGLIARFGDIVMYIADPITSADRLLGAIEAAASAEQPGPAVAERLATLAFGADREGSPFGVVAPSGDGLLLILRGRVTAEITSKDDTRELSGDRALTWVDEILPGSVLSVAVSTRGGPRPQDCPHTDLRAGVVPGGGFALHRASSSGGQLTEPNPMEPVSTEKVDESTVRKLPSELLPPAETSAPAVVPGVLGSEDGAIFPLDRSYVIGREPLIDDTVRNGMASPIVVGDDPYISRVHAYVSIDRGVVFVRDASTPDGTFIAAPGAQTWTRVGTTPTKLSPGWSLRIGNRILTYHT